MRGLRPQSGQSCPPPLVWRRPPVDFGHRRVKTTCRGDHINETQLSIRFECGMVASFRCCMWNDFYTTSSNGRYETLHMAQYCHKNKIYALIKLHLCLDDGQDNDYLCTSFLNPETDFSSWRESFCAFDGLHFASSPHHETAIHIVNRHSRNVMAEPDMLECAPCTGLMEKQQAAQGSSG